MGVVYEPVEDRIGEATTAEILVPVADWLLRSDECSAGAILLLDGLEHVLSFGFVEGSEAGIVDDKQRELGQALK